MKDYQLTEDQLVFTATPKEAIGACEGDDERVPIVILNGHVVVGFFVLYGWEEAIRYTDNKNALLLRAYSIHNGYQGNGYASASLALLPPFIAAHFPGKNEVVLAVNVKNEVAMSLYKKAGFVDRRQRAMGPSGEMYVWHKPI